MGNFIKLTIFVLALTLTVSSQGRNTLDNVVPPCKDGLLLKVDYDGFGMISAPSEARVYLQVCRDGRMAYQTARGQARTAILDSAQMNRLKAELASPEVERLNTHYSAPRAIDAFVSLAIVIPREGRTQFIKVDNLVTAWMPLPLEQLLTLADAVRSDAGFTVADFKPR